MLNFSQRLGEPIKIGNAVVYITAKPGYSDVVCIAVDAPRNMEVLRDDLVLRALSDAGFRRVGDDLWLGRRGVNGVKYTTREALAVIS